MKRLISLLLALTLLLSLAVPALADADTSLTKIQEKGEFVLGFDENFPPMGFKDETGNHVGFDLDLAAAVCEKLGVKLVLQPIDWKAKELELNTGKIDCIWNGFSISEERAKAVLFSLPYMKNEQVLVVKKDSAFEKMEDLFGKQIGLQMGSSAADALATATEFKNSLRAAVEFNDNMIAMMDLDKGAIDAVLMDTIVADYYITMKDGAYKTLEPALAIEEFGIGFRLADAALKTAVDDALLALNADGKLAEISNKWFGRDITTIKDAVPAQ